MGWDGFGRIRSGASSALGIGMMPMHVGEYGKRTFRDIGFASLLHH